MTKSELAKFRPKIRIPAGVVAQLPKFARKALRIFKTKRDLNRFQHHVGDIKIGRRTIEIWAGKDLRKRKRDFSHLAGYHPKADKIVLYNAIMKKRQWEYRKNRSLFIQRIIAHEMAHAIDKKRVIMSLRSKNSIMKSRSLVKYCCHPIEYDAEFASIAQVAVPFMLKQKRSGQMIVDLLSNSIDLTPSGPLWPIYINGYFADWCRDKKLILRFFKQLIICFFDNIHLVKDAKCIDCPIIKACLKKMKGHSRISGGRRAFAPSSLKKCA